MISRTSLLCAVLLLAPSLARASRYDPDADRSALRQAAAASHAAVIDATGLPLLPEKVPAIAAGLDEGLRQAGVASEAARSLSAGAQKRAAETAAGVKAGSERRLKDLSDPVAAERVRWDRLSSEQRDLKTKVDELSGDEKKKLLALLAKASDALRDAADGLRPLEEAVRIMGEQALEMKAAHQGGLGPLVEASSAAAAAIGHAESLPAPLAEAKARLAALGSEPREVARKRAWEALEPLRNDARLLYEAADRACNRADDFRRYSVAYGRAFDAFERARAAAGAGPVEAGSRLDEAEKLLERVRERLKKPATLPGKSDYHQPSWKRKNGGGEQASGLTAA